MPLNISGTVSGTGDGGRNVFLAPTGYGGGCSAFRWAVGARPAAPGLQ